VASALAFAVVIVPIRPYLFFVHRGCGAFYGFSLVSGVPTLFLSESRPCFDWIDQRSRDLEGLWARWMMGYLAGRTHSLRQVCLYLVASLFVSGLLMLAVGAKQHPLLTMRLRGRT